MVTPAVISCAKNCMRKNFLINILRTHVTKNAHNSLGVWESGSTSKQLWRYFTINPQVNDSLLQLLIANITYGNKVRILPFICFPTAAQLTSIVTSDLSNAVLQSCLRATQLLHKFGRTSVPFFFKKIVFVSHGHLACLLLECYCP